MSWPTKLPAATAHLVSDVQAQLSLEHSGIAVIAAWQTQRIAELVQWLLDHVPWWRERLGAQVNLGDWESLPVLSRFELQKMVALNGPAHVPDHHGSISPYHPAGPPGVPARFYTSSFNQRMLEHAFYADNQRQGRNPYAGQACISDDIPLHAGTHIAVEPSLDNGSGPQALRLLNLFTTSEHLQWLRELRPTYLTATSQWLAMALDEARKQRLVLPEIRQLLSYGGTVSTSLRNKARNQLGASIRHRYTCLECGPLAFQCPRSDDYFHVAVGNVLLEVVDDAGKRRTAQGDDGTAQDGRVLVTALHQYASPLLRHDIGDRAVLHAHCPGCALDAPTLSRLRQNV